MAFALDTRTPRMSSRPVKLTVRPKRGHQVMTVKKPYVTCPVAVVSATIAATFVANTLGLERAGVIGGAGGGAGGVMIARKKGE